MKHKGFTLVETIVGVAIAAIVIVAVYQSYTALSATISSSRLKILATDLANAQFEVMKNLPYADVGIDGSIPDGKLEHLQTATRDGVTFTITTTVRNVDDPFDGTIGGAPNDTSPADYKLVEVEISCEDCKGFQPVVLSGRVAPKNLETASDNGALFVQVFDANGQPVSDADVHITNTSLVPNVTIDDTTNVQGLLQLVDVTPSANSYQITVTKPGFSTDITYPSGAPSNPNPLKPHATVAVQQVTQISFAIDRLSTLNVHSLSTLCAPIAGFPFNIVGSKLIGQTPSIYKYSQDLSTDGAGNSTISNLEWDTYTINGGGATLDVVGTNPIVPLRILPNSTNNLDIILAPKDPKTLLVSVIDNSTGLPVSGAQVTITSTSTPDQSLLTGVGSLTQTDWSGGGGQATSSDQTRFDSSSNVSVNTPSGDITLLSNAGVYATSGTLTSSAFNLGATSTFQELSYNPTAQPLGVGADSVKFQFATNSDGSTWNFIGPDGTGSSYYTTADLNLLPQHGNGRYAKYKVFLSTADTTLTPNVSDISFTYTGGCKPPGQVAFTGLTEDSYQLTVSKSGYTTFVDDVDTSAPWKYTSVSLISE